MTREDIDNIIGIICPNDEDFEKPIISPAYLKKELEMLALEQEPSGDMECLRKGLKALEAWDELYRQIYDHHYEILKSEPSESRNAKLSLSNWILDTMTGYDLEPRERSDKECTKKI